MLAVLGRPTLWPVAIVQASRLARPGWWRRPPFLPLPDRAYLRFRMVTAYGGDGRRAPAAEDVLAYLRWCRSWRQDLDDGRSTDGGIALRRNGPSR